MFDVDDVSEGILVRLHQEFIETANDQLEDIDGKLDQLDSGQGKARRKKFCLASNAISTISRAKDQRSGSR